MSIVYRADHVLLGRKVALKLLSPQLGEDESFRERFTRESRLAASLDHPNIIPIYEAAESEGVFFIAMRYVEGSDLRAMLKDGPLDAQRVVPIIDQTANALAAAHARGLVHRDVKPANILVDPGESRGEQDHVYLSDFGVAKQIAAPGVTKAGIFVGTADYAAPEQIEGKELDPRADVYSLGCVVYECLTGTSAYDKDSEVALMYAHLLEPPPRVSDRRPDLPVEIDEVVGKAMAKSRDDRYENPKDFAAAVRNVLANVSLPAARPAELASTVLAAGLAGPGESAGDAEQPAALTTAGATTAAAAGGAADGTAPPAAPPPPGLPRGGQRRPMPQRSTLIAGGVAGGLAIALVVTLVLLLTNGGSESSATPTGTRSQTMSGDTGMGTDHSMKPTQGTPKQRLAAYVQDHSAWSCHAAPPVHGASATDVCAGDVPQDLRISVFPDAASLNAAYAAALATAGVRRNSGRCTTTHEGVEGPWYHAASRRGGRVLCYLSGNNAYIVWTSTVDNALFAASRGKLDHETLHSWWTYLHHQPL